MYPTSCVAGSGICSQVGTWRGHRLPCCRCCQARPTSPHQQEDVQHGVYGGEGLGSGDMIAYYSDWRRLAGTRIR